MGCGQSKFEQDEGVMRCKGRKQFMRDAVGFRNAFAAAHSAYCIALKDTGAAFSDYAEGEVPEHLRASSAASTSSSAVAAAVDIQPPMDKLPPPPPLPDFSTPPLQRSASMPDLPVIKPKKKAPIDAAIREEDDEEEAARRDDDSVAETATPVSAPPPLPQKPQTPPTPPPPMPDSKSMETWDYFFGSQDSMPPPTLSQPEETWPERRDLEQEKITRTPPPPVPPTVDNTPREEQPPVTPESIVVKPPPPPPPPQSRTVKKLKQGNSAHHQYANSVGTSDSKRGKIVAMAPASSNILQIMKQLDDHFLKASQSAHDVSKMLEATRMHYHSNFADSRGHINHSERIMRVITWNRSFKGLANDYANDNSDNDESETHATILDKMLAWEKKLYDEVKAGELMKIDYQRMVAKLNKQKKRNVRAEVLERTKAAVSHLHTRYIVDMQSMDSTVSEINRLRDQQLYPKLVELVYGMAKMWETMYEHHRTQLKIMVDLKSSEITVVPRETSQQHYHITEQLWDMLKGWHSQFQKLMSNQKDYIKSLNSWLKLNLVPIESSLKEKVSSPTRLPEPPIKDLLHAWNDQLEKLPDEIARNAIFSFSEIIRTIMLLQQDELQLKRKIQDTRMELEKKRRQFEDWHHKYMERRASLPEDANPEGTETANVDPVAERKVVVDAIEVTLKEEEENYRSLCKQVREKSLGSLRTHLPELFRAMSDFSYKSSEIYKSMFPIIQSKKPVDS